MALCYTKLLYGGSVKSSFTNGNQKPPEGD